MAWLFTIFSVLKTCKQKRQKHFLPWHNIWSFMNVIKPLIKFSTFCFLPLSQKSRKIIFSKCFWLIGGIIFHVSITKNTIVDKIFLNIFNAYQKLYTFKVKFSCKIFANFPNSWWMMICCKAFISINVLNINQTFFGWSNSFGSLIKLLLLESIIQHKPFARYFCMFDRIAL